MTLELDKLYAAFDLPDPALKLARGDFAPEVRSLVNAPYETVGHPPAFVPLYMVGYPVLTGWWVDPFGVRESPLVECYPHDGCRVSERFRSFTPVRQVYRVRAPPGAESRAIKSFVSHFVS